MNYGPDGNIYESSEGNFYSINPNTGAGSLIGSFGNGVQLQSIVEADGKLYGFDGNAMYSVNLSTGAATFVQDTPVGVGNFDAETPGAPISSTPEPASAVGLVICLALIAAQFRRRRHVN